MSLFDAAIIDERLKHVNTLLEIHKRTDLTIVAVNKYYDWSYVCLEEGQLVYYSIWESKVRREGMQMINGFGNNFIIIDDRFLDYQSIELRKGKHYTSCARYELEMYLDDGWRVECV